jgi:diphosphomevalonate decarboxylase
MKKTAVSPSNIAFIKYWGRKDDELRLPANGSISMNLSNLLTTTTVEFRPDYKNDIVIINSKQESGEENRVIKHLDRIRKLANFKSFAKVVSENNFPKSAGLSSSASGFAALTIAGTKAAGLNLSEKELSILARQGAGSASRSIPDGFVQWLDGNSSDTSYSVSLYPPNYWDIADVVALISTDKKDVATSEGHKRSDSSIFFKERMKHIKNKIILCKTYIKEKNFEKLGELTEGEALELHAIMLTSIPSLIYLLPESIRVIKEVKRWRENGIMAFFTLNTGQNVHILCEGKNAENVSQLAQKIEGVQKTIVNYPAKGAVLVGKHLF